MALRIKKNDRVEVRTGKYKGVVSRVLYVMPSKNKAVVENVNMRKRHMKATSQEQRGGIIEKEGPIDLSNLLLYCEKCKSGVRFGADVKDDGDKRRVCRKCGAAI
jgi:large subunit ribosomal protein L24